MKRQHTSGDLHLKRSPKKLQAKCPSLLQHCSQILPLSQPPPHQLANHRPQVIPLSWLLSSQTSQINPLQVTLGGHSSSARWRTASSSPPSRACWTGPQLTTSTRPTRLLGRI